MKKVLILILAVVLSLSMFAMVACQPPCETHVDGNHDGICDVCETTGLSVTHTDSNHDGKCDGCGGAAQFEHVDAAHDGKCDVCNKTVAVNHVDANNDGYCDVEACGHKYDWVDALADAKEYVDGLYLNAEEITAVDYTVTTIVSIGGVKYNVAWEIQSDVAGQTAAVLGEVDEDKQLTINVDEFSAAEVAYKLVATISDAEGHSVKVEYARKVNKFVVSTYEEYLAHCKAGDGVSFTIRAYVLGAVSITSSSKGSLYLQDADGNGYYAYAPALPADATASEEALDAYFPFGTEVCVTGTGTVYGGQYEFNKGCQVIKTGKVATAEELPFENVTEVWGNAKNQGDHDTLMQDQNKLVVLEEAIFTKVDGNYYYFTVNGVQYNIYKNNYFMSEQADIDALFAKFEAGKAATIKGIVSCYSNLYQIYPLDVECISNVHTPELSDAEKIEVAKSALTLVGAAQKGDVIELPAKGANDTTITWALDGTYDCATLADGKLTITATPSAETKVKLVATITSGSVSDTKEFEITVAGASINFVSFAQATELAGTTKDQYTTDKYYMIGTIKEVYNTTYGNMYIVDEQGNEFTIYGTYSADGSLRYDKMENAPKAGDVVIVYGILGYYNAPQMKNGWIIASYDVQTFAEATELSGTTKDQYTTDKYYMIGTIKEVYNTTYGNMYITDAAGNEFTIYGTYSADGSLRYDKMPNAPKAGDVVIVYGILGYYNAPQMKNGWIVVVAPAGEAPVVPPVEEHECESKCPTCGGCLDATCTETACATKCPGHEVVEDGAPIAGTYVLEMYQSKKGQNYYFTGTMSGYYFATSTNKADAVEITLAKLENGKYTMKLANGQYLAIVASGTHLNAVMQSAVCEWTWNAEIGSFTAQAGSEVAFLGTYGDYYTIGGSKLSYASTSYVAKLVDPAIVPPVESHECANVCPTCGKCTNEDCAESVCADKCEGHQPPHECESKCPTCGKCLDEDCAESVCADKCEGHEPVVQEEKYTLAMPADSATWTEETLINDIFYATNKAKTESVKISGASYEADGLTFSGKQISLTGGKVQLKDGAFLNAIKVTVESGKQGHFAMYVASKAYDDGREIRISILDTEGNAVAATNIMKNGVAGEFGLLSTTEVEKYEFDLPAGTYYLGGSSGGAYLYGMTVTLSAAQAEEPAVVINGTNYSEAQAEEALLALKADDVVTILANATIAKEYTFVAANYTIGEGAVLVAQANMVAPAGAKLTVSANAKLVVEAGVTIDISALTQEAFATSTEARLEIAAGATVIMPAYTEQLWKDAYLKVVIEQMVADSDVGAKLVLGDTKLTKTANGWEAEAPANTLTIEEAIALGKTFEHDKYSAEKYYVTGVIVEVYQTTYGNMRIRDEKGNVLTIYGTYSADGKVRYDAMSTKPQAGDTVTIYGIVGQYSNTPQIKNGWVVAHVLHEECTDYSEATCLEAAKCVVCGKAKGEALGHTTEKGTCERCGETIGASGTVATFTFGANGSAAHVDGNDLGTSKTYTDGAYSLKLTGLSKVYGPAYDAKGNSCIKLGTSSKTGSLKFTVPEDVTKVVIYVAQYKANATKITVNGQNYTISTASNNGAYTAITVDTTTTKTVTFATVSGGVRCMIDAIEFIAG